MTGDAWMKNRSVFVALLVALSASPGLQAQTRCSTDSFGTTTCRDSDGRTSRTSTDTFGNTTTRDNRGTTIRGSTDPFGNTTYRDNRGTTVRGSTDVFGNSTYRDNKGGVVRASTDVLATPRTATAMAARSDAAPTHSATPPVARVSGATMGAPGFAFPPCRYAARRTHVLFRDDLR